MELGFTALVYYALTAEIWGPGRLCGGLYSRVLIGRKMDEDYKADKQIAALIENTYRTFEPWVLGIVAEELSAR